MYNVKVPIKEINLSNSYNPNTENIKEKITEKPSLENQNTQYCTFTEISYRLWC